MEELSTGAINPVLVQLDTLMGDKYKMPQEMREEVSLVKDELSAMKVRIMEIELLNPNADQMPVETFWWQSKVREMSYTMENCIDELMLNPAGVHPADADAKADFIQKITPRFLRIPWSTHQFANRIEEFKVLALQARYLRYIDAILGMNSGSTHRDPGQLLYHSMAFPCWLEAGLVGIDSPKEELSSRLTDDTNKKLTVMSVVGMGGLGKTTLVKQVYGKIEGQFNCAAFVAVSLNPSITGLLRNLQLMLGLDHFFCAREEEGMIQELAGYLQHKRYLIVVDELWDQSTWDTISRAFPENNNRSRVIVTTRVEHVARWACRGNNKCLYRMKLLNDEDSRKLLLKTVFGSEDECPSQFGEVSAEILKKCGGLPLAVLAVATKIASSQAGPRNEWEIIRNSHDLYFTNPAMKEMINVLNLSYMHLPPHLRTCFLYLGMYPEDYEIDRDDLVRQWIAESFVSSLHGQDLDDVAKRYFNELISRSLILPERTDRGEVLSCRVHSAVLGLILAKCEEHNFISVARNSEGIAKLYDREFKVRRLSLKDSASAALHSTKPTTLGVALSEVHSLVCFEDPWSADRDKTVVDLTVISQLLRLRYLRVSTRQRIKLPALIQAPRWSIHLILPKYKSLPEGIENMKPLHTLHWFDVGKKSPKDIKVLGELTNLRDLRVSNNTMGYLATKAADALVSSIGKLRNLRYLRIDDGNEDKDHLLSSLADPPPYIKELKLGGWLFFRFPKWISALRGLYHLNLRVWDMSTEAVGILGELPSLVHLSFSVTHVPEGRAVIVGMGLFLVLKHLEFRSRQDAAAYLGFEVGAMPELQKLALQFQDRHWGGAAPAGMECLVNLEEIHVGVISSRKESAEQVCRDAGPVFRNAIHVHPGRPSFSIRGLRPNNGFW